jgi:hypothetical protein
MYTELRRAIRVSLLIQEVMMLEWLEKGADATSATHVTQPPELGEL